MRGHASLAHAIHRCTNFIDRCPQVRAIPGCGFSAPWFRAPRSNTQLTGSPWLPADLHAELSEAGQRITAHVVLAAGEVCDKVWRPSWEGRGLSGDTDSRSGRSLLTLPKL